MTKSIIIDSSYLISTAIKQDNNHHLAPYFHTQVYAYQSIYITNYIFAEVSTVLSQRLGKVQSGIILQRVLLDKIAMIHVNEEIDKQVRSEFLKLKDKNISYVDLSTSVIAKINKISAVATFDKHFKKLGKEYGFEVVGC